MTLTWRLDITEAIEPIARIYAIGALYAAVDYVNGGEGARHGWTLSSLLHTTALWPWNLYNRFALRQEQ